MHMLNLPWVFAVSTEAPGANVSAAAELCQEAQENGRRVIAAAIAVEKELEKVINARIVGKPEGVHPFFADHILSADWFSFSAKRKIALEVFDEFQHVRGQDRADLENVLRKVMSFRNRFAHGHFVVKNDKVFISYFENKLHEDELTDQLWQEIEQRFNQAIQLIAKGQKSMGIPVGWGLAG